jgi:hypothetical protein
MKASSMNGNSLNAGDSMNGNSMNEILSGQIVNFCGSKFRVLDVLDQDHKVAVLQVQRVGGSSARSVISFKFEEPRSSFRSISNSRSKKMIIC